jgi:hypothetical protein
MLGASASKHFSILFLILGADDYTKSNVHSYIALQKHPDVFYSHNFTFDMIGRLAMTPLYNFRITRKIVMNKEDHVNNCRLMTPMIPVFETVTLIL